MDEQEYYRELQEIRKESARLKEEFEQLVRKKTSWNIETLNGKKRDSSYWSGEPEH